MWFGLYDIVELYNILWSNFIRQWCNINFIIDYLLTYFLFIKFFNRNILFIILILSLTLTNIHCAKLSFSNFLIWNYILLILLINRIKNKTRLSWHNFYYYVLFFFVRLITSNFFLSNLNYFTEMNNTYQLIVWYK